jgi:two-component system cell cycle response regulator CpdR
MIQILLAEDDGATRSHLARALERGGYRVTAVDGGVDALARIGRQPFDLLVADVAMTDLDGIELARRAVALAPQMRVMFITGFAAVALVTGDAAAPARQLSAPFHLRNLVSEVGRIFAVGAATEL